MKNQKRLEPLTKNYFNKVAQNFVTKDYFDTATQNFVTKDYFDTATQNFVTKEIFSRSINLMDDKIERVEKTMNINFSVIKEDINRIIDRMDFFMGKYKGIDQEQLAQGLHIKEFRETLQDHEKRISALEPRTT